MKWLQIEIERIQKDLAAAMLLYPQNLGHKTALEVELRMREQEYKTVLNSNVMNIATMKMAAEQCSGDFLGYGEWQ